MVKSRSTEDWIFDLVTVVLLGAVGFAAVFPLMFVVSMSLTPYSEVLRNGGFIVFPRSITFDGYTQVLTDQLIPRAFLVTVFITAAGTAISLILSVLLAYPMSKKRLPLRSVFIFMVVFTMLFNGGVIPTYLVVKGVGLLDSIWAMIIPSAIHTFNILIMKSFFENLPEELFESARMDGAREMRVLFQIVLPLSLPMLLTIGLFYGVQSWNTLFSALMYVNDRALFPLQVVIREILIGSTMIESGDFGQPVHTETFKMSAVIVSTLPVIIVYPFIQKYFNKGMLLGSIKG